MYKYNPFTDNLDLTLSEQEIIDLIGGDFLKLDQTTPQTVENGMPTFSGGINTAFDSLFTDGENYLKVVNQEISILDGEELFTFSIPCLDTNTSILGTKLLFNRGIFSTLKIDGEDSDAGFYFFNYYPSTNSLEVLGLYSDTIGNDYVVGIRASCRFSADRVYASLYTTNIVSESNSTISITPNGTGLTDISALRMEGGETGVYWDVDNYDIGGGSYFPLLKPIASTSIFFNNKNKIGGVDGSLVIAGATSDSFMDSVLMFYNKTSDSGIIVLSGADGNSMFFQLSGNSSESVVAFVGSENVSLSIGDNGAGLAYTASDGTLKISSDSLIYLENETLIKNILRIGDVSESYSTTIQCGTQTSDIVYTLPTSYGSAGDVLADVLGNGVLSWQPTTTHDAVTLDEHADDILSITDQELGLQVQSPNVVFAGPSTGVNPNYPTFRALVSDDIPDLSSLYLTSESDPLSLHLSQSTPQTVGNTTNRMAKLWATDIECTNAITASITGSSAKTTNLIGGNATTLLGSIPYQSNTDTTTLLEPNTTTTKKFLSMTGDGTNGAAPAWSTVSKSDVGLSNVENTALSTWAGSANITTLGTISTGTWSANTIAVNKGGTGITVYAVGDLLYADTTSSLTKLADVAVGSVLVSGGLNTAPAWSSSPSLTGSLTAAQGLYSGTNYGVYLGSDRFASYGPGNQDTNVCIGKGAMANNKSSGIYLVAIGYNVLHSNTTGTRNFALGYLAAFSNESGCCNTVIGNAAMYNNVTGFYNIAIGDGALYYATDSDSNFAIGRQSLYHLNNGDDNFALGNYALNVNATGSGNMAIGYYAGAYEYGSNTFYLDNMDRGNSSNSLAKSLLVGAFNSDASLQTLKTNSSFTVTYDFNVKGNSTLGDASTDTVTCNGRFIPRLLATNPQYATPANRPAGSLGEIARYSGKLYLCTNSSTPTWELFTSA